MQGRDIHTKEWSRTSIIDPSKESSPDTDHLPIDKVEKRLDFFEKFLYKGVQRRRLNFGWEVIIRKDFTIPVNQPNFGFRSPDIKSKRNRFIHRTVSRRIKGDHNSCYYTLQADLRSAGKILEKVHLRM